MAEHLSLEQIQASPEGSFVQRTFFAGQVNVLRQIRVLEGPEAVEKALADTAERDGREVAEKLRAALNETDRRTS